jgi:hypothetical protein
MKLSLSIGAALCLLIVFPAYADYTVSNEGAWPESWPSELDPLRARARTFEGPLAPLLHYAIPMADRETFEAAWPQILKVKTPGAPIVLRRGPSFWLGDEARAGIVIHTPPRGEPPVADARKVEVSRSKTIYIELIVDGEVIDLNRIALPADTPVIDERFDMPIEERSRVLVAQAV